MSLKLVPAALLLFVVIAAGLGQTLRTSDAAVSGDLVRSAAAMTSGGTPVTVTIPVGAPNPNEDVSVSLTSLDASVSGAIVVVACTPDCPDPAGLGESTSLNDPALVVTQDGLSQILVAVGLTCSSDSTVTITADTASNEEEIIEITCIAAPTDGGGDGGEDGGSVALIPGVGQFAVAAEPNILPCGGGTTTITAEVIEQFGISLDAYEIRFRIVSGSGALTQTSSDTAKLTLGANQTQVVVAATLYFEVGDENGIVEARTPTIRLQCNGFSTVVVTAAPNVIDCTGTTTLTATARDANGHVVPGVGFHFVTSAGLLAVDPNNASTEEGTATLKLRPGDGDAIVIVSVGTNVGTYEFFRSVIGSFTTDVQNFDGVTGSLPDTTPYKVDDELGFVTVRQNCLSTTTGQIKVNSSSVNIACGEKVFIGLSVIDEDLKTVIDNTPLTLIATAGGFFGGEGVLLGAAQVPTSHGEANTIYTAPANFNGEVKITAASGDAYGFEKLNVSCVVPATSTGTGAAPCIDIGDGVCITPPNTGRNSITPPNTGSAGLK